MTEFIRGQDRINISMEDFKDLELNYTDFCGFYIDTRTLCPLMVEDLKQNNDGTSIRSFNFNVSICLFTCDYFRKIKIPEKIELDYHE